MDFRLDQHKNRSTLHTQVNPSFGAAGARGSVEDTLRCLKQFDRQAPEPYLHGLQTKMKSLTLTSALKLSNTRRVTKENISFEIQLDWHTQPDPSAVNQSQRGLVVVVVKLTAAFPMELTITSTSPLSMHESPFWQCSRNKTHFIQCAVASVSSEIFAGSCHGISLYVTRFFGHSIEHAWNWTYKAHPALQHKSEQLFVAENLDLPCDDVAQASSPPVLKPCSAKAPLDPRHYWRRGPEGLEWIPHGCSLGAAGRGDARRHLSDKKIVLVGDSQMRTIFQAMLMQFCPESGFVTFPATGEKKQFCSHKPCSPGACCKPSRREQLCSGIFTVYDDGCWDGGASWSKGETLLAFVFAQNVNHHAHLELRCLQHNYDLILYATGLHDTNNAIDRKYRVALSEQIYQLARWGGSANVFHVGPWASLAALRRNGYGWAGSLAKAQSLDDQAAASLAPCNLSHVRLLDVTTAVRGGSPDGVHLSFPHPLETVTSYLLHLIVQDLSPGRSQHA